MLRHGRKAAFRRFVFPKRCSPHRTRDSADGSPTFRGRVHPQTPKTAQKSASFQNAFSARAGQRLRDTASRHTMLRAALKRLDTIWLRVFIFVSTHTMLRAALKRNPKLQFGRFIHVSTHTMLRAALKRFGCFRPALHALSRHTQCCVRH